MATLPLLLPTQPAKTTSPNAWEPKQHLLPPQPPVIDDQRIHDLELAVQRQLLDGKALKKTRPRRTVDYAGAMGRWALVCPYLNFVSRAVSDPRHFLRAVSQATT